MRYAIQKESGIRHWDEPGTVLAAVSNKEIVQWRRGWMGSSQLASVLNVCPVHEDERSPPRRVSLLGIFSSNRPVHFAMTGSLLLQYKNTARNPENYYITLGISYIIHALGILGGVYIITVNTRKYKVTPII